MKQSMGQQFFVSQYCVVLGSVILNSRRVRRYLGSFIWSVKARVTHNSSHRSKAKCILMTLAEDKQIRCQQYQITEVT
jgi:hypothetical protein